MKINPRETAFLSLGGIFVFTLLYYLLILSPTISREKSLITYIGKKETDLVKMVELARKWDRFIHTQAVAGKILTRRGEKFTLLSYLEGISREIGISKRIQYMKPLSFQEESGPLKPEGMEIKLDDIDITQLINFLHKIEYSEKLLNIKRIKIQRSTKDNVQSLKVTVQVSTYTSI